MAFLAVDTSTSSLSLCIGDEQGRVLAAWTTVAPKLHASALHPLLDEQCALLGLDIADLHGVATGVGPGSYTGVRIGVTAAKTLAYALAIPVVGVSSLAAAAYAERSGHAPVAAAFAARRGEVYTGLYGSSSDGQWYARLSEGKRSYAEAAQQLAGLLLERTDDVEQASTSQSASVSLVGDGAKEVAALLQQQYGMTVRIAQETATVRAEDVYRLGYRQLVNCLTSPEEDVYEERAHALVPRYLQLAEAEARWRSEQLTKAASGSE